MVAKRVPGLIKDPWRNQEVAPPSLTDPIPATVHATPATPDDVENDALRHNFATIELKGYGGITVEGVDTPSAAAVRLLDFCVKYRSEIESCFTVYGVLVAQTAVKAMPQLKFYIQRADGWLIAIPEAASRDTGCLQLIQAMNTLYVDPGLRKKLETYKIRPYKM